MVKNLDLEPNDNIIVTVDTQIYDLITSNCLSFFDICNLNYDFFKIPIDDCENNEKFSLKTIIWLKIL